MQKMREIKFRAWNPYQGRMMVEKTAYELSQDPYPSQCFDHLMQYTGLKDKNGFGSEIWQDDLIRCSGHGIGRVDKNYWGEWCVFFQAQYDDEDPYEVPIHDLIMEQDLLEIVGNIHENPELLNNV